MTDSQLAHHLAQKLARDPSTVEGSTVTVRYKATGELLAIATAPCAASRDTIMSIMEQRFRVDDLYTDPHLADIAAYTAQRHDEMSREVEAVFERMLDDAERASDLLE